MPNKKDTNFNTYKYRKFENENYGLSIDPSYNGKDPFDFKIGGQHLRTKFKMARRVG